MIVGVTDASASSTAAYSSVPLELPKVSTETKSAHRPQKKGRDQEMKHRHEAKSQSEHLPRHHGQKPVKPRAKEKEEKREKEKVEKAARSDEEKHDDLKAGRGARRASSKTLTANDA